MPPSVPKTAARMTTTSELSSFSETVMSVLLTSVEKLPKLESLVRRNSTAGRGWGGVRRGAGE